MSAKFEKLKSLLRELFQLDQPDLDFGLYRIMHAKAAEVTAFLERDLLPQVKAEFGLYKTADKAELQKELDKVIAGLKAAEVDPDTSPKVKDLRAKLANEAVDIGGLENDVYDHLLSFFSRYYSEGDFVSKRKYSRDGKYAIPYDGEEVKLYWANHDQYYIKTSEYLRDYSFRIRITKARNTKGTKEEEEQGRVHFRLVDAAEGEHGNVKAAAGKDRRFALAESDFFAIEGEELVIRFTYQPVDGKVKQSQLIAEAVERILQNNRESPKDESTKRTTINDSDSSSVSEFRLSAFRDSLAALAPTEKNPKRTLLEKHLIQYTARNTFDYFIHKDLGGFLRRELDFFIKNEVMRLDDIENETAPRVEQYLSKIKVLRRIAGKIIAFLAQLEDFQRALWLKKKFVVETQYCVALKEIPEEFHKEIAANKGQQAEWKALGFFELKDDADGLFASSSRSALRIPHSALIDTRHFDADFTARLLAALGDLDEKTDGVLFHSENFQALNLMQARYKEKVKCVYIDPPYNTGSDGFAYKDSYQHSSWIAMVNGRLELTRSIMSQHGAITSSIDDHEVHYLKNCLEQVFGSYNFVAQIEWQKRYTRSNNTDNFTTVIEHLLMYRKSDAFSVNLLKRTEEANARFANPDNDPRGAWKATPFLNQVSPEQRPALCYPIKNPHTGSVTAPTKKAWRLEESEFHRLSQDNRLWWGRDRQARVPDIKTYLSEVREGMTPINYWEHQFAGNTDIANYEIKSLFEIKLFDTPKPTLLVQRVIEHVCDESDSAILDFFAGSGTTGHAVINLNREDGGRRKVILVEMADYFDTVLLPRLKKVAFTPEWKDGRPKRVATAEEVERGPRVFKIVRLESYEDTLNNLELKRTPGQQSLLDAAEAQGADQLREQYLLQYLLKVETRESQSLLNVAAFTDPTAYKLVVKRPGSDESREVNVDLLETFNWLLGLTVTHIAAPQAFTAEFKRDKEGRLQTKIKHERPKVEIEKKKNGSVSDFRVSGFRDSLFWFRTVEGTMPDGRKALVIWRKLTGTPEEDNLVLDEWFTKQGYSSKDSEFGLIYVNGGNNLENLKTPEDTWKVRLIEDDFHRLMFAAEGV